MRSSTHLSRPVGRPERGGSSPQVQVELGDERVRRAVGREDVVLGEGRLVSKRFGHECRHVVRREARDDRRVVGRLEGEADAPVPGAPQLGPPARLGEGEGEGEDEGEGAPQLRPPARLLGGGIRSGG